MQQHTFIETQCNSTHVRGLAARAILNLPAKVVADIKKASEHRERELIHLIHKEDNVSAVKKFLEDNDMDMPVTMNLACSAMVKACFKTAMSKKKELGPLQAHQVLCIVLEYLEHDSINCTREDIGVALVALSCEKPTLREELNDIFPSVESV